MFGEGALGLLPVGGEAGLQEVGAEQVVLNAGKDGVFKHLTKNPPAIAANTLLRPTGAGELAIGDCVVRAALAADDLAAEQILDLFLRMERPLVRRLGEPCLHPIPEILVNDCQFRMLDDDPLRQGGELSLDVTLTAPA